MPRHIHLVFLMVSAFTLVTTLTACGTDSAPAGATGLTSASSRSDSASLSSSGLSNSSEPLAAFKLPACYNPSSTTGETVSAHACSWSFNALRLQNLIIQRQPLVDSFFLATHNSINSSAYPGLSSSGDPNHTLTMVEQLGLGMTGLELDVHWVFHAASQRFAPVLCHGVGASQGHVGCTPQDRLLSEGLAEIRAFLDRPESAGTVLLLDIENVLQEYVPPNSSQVSVEGHDEAAKLITDILGDKLFRPAVAGTCNKIDPVRFTRQQVLDAGKQVVIVGGCGAGEVWPTVVFDMPRKQKANDGFDASTCEADYFKASDFRTTFTRVWHDSTRLSSVAIQGLQPITSTELKTMVRCGLHQASLDQLVVGDERLPAAVWSWDVAHPRTATGTQCTFMSANGRWRNSACGESRPVACRSASGWTIPPATASGSSAASVCEAAGLRFDLPRSAADNLRLDAVRKAAKADSLWIRWRDVTGQGQFTVPAPTP